MTAVSLFVFKQLGGTVGEVSSIIFGVPEFKAGQQVVLFLDTASDGTLRIAQLFMGKYDVVKDQKTGELRVERKIDQHINLIGGNKNAEITNSASLAEFKSKIKQVLGKSAAEVKMYTEKYEAVPEEFEAVPIIETPPEYVAESIPRVGVKGGTSLRTKKGDDLITPLFTFLSGGYRWFQQDDGGAVLYWVNPTGSPVPGDSVPEVMQAIGSLDGCANE